MKLQQEVHYKTLVQSARQYDEEQDKAEVVERDQVDEALTEKLELAREFAQQLRGKSWKPCIILVNKVGFHELLEL